MVLVIVSQLAVMYSPVAATAVTTQIVKLTDSFLQCYTIRVEVVDLLHSFLDIQHFCGKHVSSKAGLMNQNNDAYFFIFMSAYRITSTVSNSI